MREVGVGGGGRVGDRVGVVRFGVGVALLGRREVR